MRAPYRRATTLLMLLTLFVSGCTPALYRHWADAEVYDLVDCVASDPRWPLEDFGLEVDERSRWFDPSCPDCPPMPPDDPTAHRLMHCVDCKRGDDCWHACGDTDSVENPYWQDFLPRDAEGAVVLDLQGAIQTALLHSRNYQRQLEELYLSALDVTLERYRFDTQFFGGLSTFFTSDGPLRSGVSGASNTLDVSVFPGSNRLRATKLFATGAELVVGLANSLVWEFSGTNRLAATTLLDFSLVQPLLRGAGRAVVLESLTDAERDLLANVRQLERYRRGFYADVAVGRSTPRGPSRGGFTLSDIGLTRASGTGGFLSLLQNQQEIRNQVANVHSLRESVDQLQAAHEAGRIDRFQVDLARQALYNAQSRLLSIRSRYETSLDAYKFRLGLPPSLDVKIEDSQLHPFALIDPRLDKLQKAAKRLIEELRREEPILDSDLALLLSATQLLCENTQDQLQVVQADYQTMQERLPERTASLRRLASRGEVTDGLVDREPLDPNRLLRRDETLGQDLTQLIELFDRLWMRLEGINVGSAALDSDQRRADLAEFLTDLSSELLELALVQAQTRLESVQLPTIELEPDAAIQIAIANRRDLMNARAAVVDTWRQIRLRTNDLESELDLVFSGDLSNRGDNPFQLDSRTGRLRVGFEFDAPFDRFSERNDYRESLIDYQRARRQYTAMVDRISQSLRETLRTLRLNELNFELRRAAVNVAVSQVLLTHLRLSRPPRPGETSEFGATTARDLVQSLTELLNVQNEFMNIWVSYEVQRVNLDLDLGTMQLDSSGMWNDPGGNIGVVAPPEQRSETCAECVDSVDE